MLRVVVGGFQGCEDPGYSSSGYTTPTPCWFSFARVVQLLLGAALLEFCGRNPDSFRVDEDMRREIVLHQVSEAFLCFVFECRWISVKSADRCRSAGLAKMVSAISVAQGRTALFRFDSDLQACVPCARELQAP